MSTSANTTTAARDTAAPQRGPTTPVTGLRRGAFLGYRWALLAFLLAGVAQIFLAGLGVFSLHDQAGGRFGLRAAPDLGFAMAGLALLILVLALIARPGARAIVGAAVLVLLTSLMQSLLAGLADRPRGLWRPARPRRAAHPGHRGLPVRPGPAART